MASPNKSMTSRYVNGRRLPWGGRKRFWRERYEVMALRVFSRLRHSKDEAESILALVPEDRCFTALDFAYIGRASCSKESGMDLFQH